MTERIALKPEGLAEPFHLSLHDREDLLSRELRAHAVWEPRETELVISHLHEGETFVDVGANIGYYSLLASNLVGPSGHVYAFEPERANYELLTRNVHDHPLANFSLYRLALSNRASEARLYLSDDNLGDHRLFDDEAREAEAVETLPGDEVLCGEVDGIDFLKIDTQGAEWLVVDGMKQSIGASESIRMIVEYWPWGLLQCGGSARALVELLATFGLAFSVIDHVNGGLLPSGPDELIHMAEAGDLLPQHRGFVNLFLER